MANDLIVVKKIEKRLRQRRPDPDNVFPLSPTHRKELRQLRDRNITGIKLRLNDIRKLKRDEFFEKYSGNAEKELEKVAPQIDVLNKAFAELVDEINKGIEGIKELEKKYDMQFIAVSSDYGDIPALREYRASRTYRKNQKAVEDKLKEMFDDKFAKKFQEVQDMIDKMLEQYEEAINFGDLEIVKELYYGLKDADGFLDKVSKIKV